MNSCRESDCWWNSFCWVLFALYALGRIRGHLDNIERAIREAAPPPRCAEREVTP